MRFPTCLLPVLVILVPAPVARGTQWQRAPRSIDITATGSAGADQLAATAGTSWLTGETPIIASPQDRKSPVGARISGRALVYVPAAADTRHASRTHVHAGFLRVHAPKKTADFGTQFLIWVIRNWPLDVDTSLAV